MSRIHTAKRSFVTRNVDLNDAHSLSSQLPEEGDLVLARVDRIRQHGRLESPEGRRVHLYKGDELILVAGNRYATDQYHATTPTTLGRCHLVAAGGIAADVVGKSAQVKPATEITLVGTLIDQAGTKLNLKNYKKLQPSYIHPNTASIPVLVVLGSDMNSGKTSMACSIIKGFSHVGVKAAGSKLTGTGAGPDYWKMLDSGAYRVRDFVDNGYPSTVGLSANSLIDLLRVIKSDATQNGADLLIVEVADGVLQPDNQKLLSDPRFLKEVSGAVVAADSATAAVYCCERLIQQGIQVHGLGGLFTRSELAAEEVSLQLGLPVYRLDELQANSTASYLMNLLSREQANGLRCAF
jgi:hypothetical protein